MTNTEKKLIKQAIAKIVGAPAKDISLLESTPITTCTEYYLIDVRYNAILLVEYHVDILKYGPGKYLAGGLTLGTINR